jgi:putative RecB family exonuclease
LGQLFSHSRLASFESCPKKFQFRYVLRIPAESESIEAFVGKRVHEVLERIYRAVARGQVPSLAQVLHRFGVLWDENFDPLRIRIARGELSPADYRQRGEQGLTHYYRANYPFDADETLAVEKRFRFHVDSGGRYAVQGIVDRLSRARDGALEIHDYKTSQRVPSQGALDRDRQLALYQIGVEEAFGSDRPVRLVWHYVMAGQVRRSERSRDALCEVRKHTIAVIDSIRAEKRFEPRPSPLCSWCEYAALCPASLAHKNAKAEPAISAAPEAAISVPPPAHPGPAIAPPIEPPAAAAAAIPRAATRRRRPRASVDGQLSLL